MNSVGLHQMSERVYWLDPDEKTDRPILGAVAGTHGTLMIEAGNSPSHAAIFLKELARHDIAPPAFVTATHWHWDHAFGASVINAPFITHRETRRIIQEMAALDWSDAALDLRVREGSEIPFCQDMIKAEYPEPDRKALVIRLPDIAFTTELELDLGGVTCRLIHVGGDHGSDNSIVYIPEEKLIFLGDCMYENYYAGPLHYTIENFFPLADRLLSYDAEQYLFAHAPNPMSRAEMTGHVNWIKTIGRTVDHVGPYRERTIAELETLLREPLSEDDIEIMDAFIAGVNI